MGARLKFWRRNRVPKKGSRDEAVFLATSPLVTAPPSNLTRLLHNTASYAGYNHGPDSERYDWSSTIPFYVGLRQNTLIPSLLRSRY